MASKATVRASDFSPKQVNRKFTINGAQLELIAVVSLTIIIITDFERTNSILHKTPWM